MADEEMPPQEDAPMKAPIKVDADEALLYACSRVGKKGSDGLFYATDEVVGAIRPCCQCCFSRPTFRSGPQEHRLLAAH
jgi:hypothetical protein